MCVFVVDSASESSGESHYSSAKLVIFFILLVAFGLNLVLWFGAWWLSSLLLFKA